MSTRITHQLTYDARLADVAAMLADPAFRSQVNEALGVLRDDVSVVGQGPGMQVVLERVQSADGIPSVAAKFVGDEITYVQTETWTTLQHADVVVTIPGKPAEMSGTIELAESGGRTVETVTVDVKVGIPLVGGKIEKMIGDLLVGALKVENATGRGYLSR